MNVNGIKLQFQPVTLAKDTKTIEQVGQLFMTHPATNRFEISDLKSKLNAKYFYVITGDNNALIAAASACVDESNSAVFKILNFIVSARYRGLGIGAWFLAKIESEARKVLASLPSNTSNLKIGGIPGGDSAFFYIRQGYESQDFLLIKKL
ncbi:hypothetical protein CWE13_07470 [Aliidiomarina shirensis]|uniref:N-acetyltransferase domain-containing protein n=1 Tax=Aliidiomarina shirensis TaxID=1048642 RepID=A0A432WVH7_9GAMM|nr:GNAT family N-acetyltransferase [Aliidiomarina shirensis]RUO37774.1 hypothetical protein CWE13_07470 [Aliidiomarina shirensis]